MKELTIDEILDGLRSNEVDANALATHLFDCPAEKGYFERSWNLSCKEQLGSLDVLHMAFVLYQGLSDDVIDLKVMSHSTAKAQWAQKSVAASDARAFACTVLPCSSSAQLTSTRRIL